MAAVASTLLTDDISIVCADDGGGWSFIAWQSRLSSLSVCPSSDDQLRRFPTFEAATAFFRRQYTSEFFLARAGARIRPTH